MYIPFLNMCKYTKNKLLSDWIDLKIIGLLIAAVIDAVKISPLSD